MNDCPFVQFTQSTLYAVSVQCGEMALQLAVPGPQGPVLETAQFNAPFTNSSTFPMPADFGGAPFAAYVDGLRYRPSNFTVSGSAGAYVLTPTFNPAGHSTIDIDYYP